MLIQTLICFGVNGYSSNIVPFKPSSRNVFEDTVKIFRKVIAYFFTMSRIWFWKIHTKTHTKTQVFAITLHKDVWDISSYHEAESQDTPSMANLKGSQAMICYSGSAYFMNFRLTYYLRDLGLKVRWRGVQTCSFF